MPDREKVINMKDKRKIIDGLEHWIQNEENGVCFIPLNLCKKTIELLKEQEAVVPNPVHNSFRWFACGKCDCSITREDRFCPRCGRAVKWE